MRESILISGKSVRLTRAGGKERVGTRTIHLLGVSATSKVVRQWALGLVSICVLDIPEVDIASRRARSTVAVADNWVCVAYDICDVKSDLGIGAAGLGLEACLELALSVVELSVGSVDENRALVAVVEGKCCCRILGEGAFAFLADKISGGAPSLDMLGEEVDTGVVRESDSHSRNCGGGCLKACNGGVGDLSGGDLGRDKRSANRAGLWHGHGV